MEIVLTIFLFAGTLYFINFWGKQLHKQEVDKFREFVIALKSRDLSEYSESLPTYSEEMANQEQEEITELENTDPEVLLKAIKIGQ